MTFSKEWEQSFSSNTHISVWPWSDVVSLVNQNCKSIISKPDGVNVLELGCGAGPNIPFFEKIGFNYHAIEGSSTIVKRLHKKFPKFKDKILCGDFTREQPFNNKFDLILDRAALTHNNTNSIKFALNLVKQSLKKNALFIGIDWFSKNHSDSTKGIEIDDKYTRTNIMRGPFIGVGKVHFSNLSHMLELLHDFEIIFLEEKLSIHHKPISKYQFASWNFVARKKNV